MGPSFKGRNLPRKLILLPPVIIVSVVICIIVFPCHTACQNDPSASDYSTSSPLKSSVIISHNQSHSRPEHRSQDLIHNHGSTTSENGYVDTGEILRRALINHTLHTEGEEDLDKLIFSALPKGSKLVLQSVKVVETDEDGNPIVGKTSPVHWDVKITNATSDDSNSDDSSEEYDTSDQEEEASEPVQNQVVDGKKFDLASSASHPSHAQANYKSYGSKELEKEKTKKYHHGNTNGKTKKITVTDTDGKTVTNYKGKEDGVNKYDHTVGKAVSDEGERYRDTKKKNKGRRVSGFKRVYHKEEFQRTEHFYDDEDAKRIAESYGIKDDKEHSKYGAKDDDHKYHGKKKEYVDGKEIKDEKGTSHGYDKGHNTEHKDSEKYKHGSHYKKSQSHGTPNSQHHSPPSAEYHPSHNYHAGAGSSSNPKSTVPLHPPHNYMYFNFKPGYVQTNFKPSINPIEHDNTVAVMTKVPMTATYHILESESKQDASASVAPSSIMDDVSLSFKNRKENGNENSLKKSKKTKKPIVPLEKPDVYFSPRNRYVEAEEGQKDVAKGKNPYVKNPYGHYQWSNNPSKRKKLDNKNSNKLYNTISKNNTLNETLDEGEEKERNGRKIGGETVVGNPLLDPNLGGYSTLYKIPVNYIDLESTSVQPRIKSPEIVSDISPTETPSEEKEDDAEESSEEALPSSSTLGKTKGNYPTPLTPRPLRPQGQNSGGMYFGIGDPDLVKDIQSTPFPFQSNRYPPQQQQQQYSPGNIQRLPGPISTLVQGVKQKLMRPLIYSPVRHPALRPLRYKQQQQQLQQQQQSQQQYDTSNYPPNVVSNSRSINGKKTLLGPLLPSSSYRKYNSTKPLTGFMEVGNSEIMDSEEEDEEDMRHPLPQLPPKKLNVNRNKPPHPGYPPHHHNNNHNPTRHRIPHSLPPFMNTLMDSVASFFGSVG